MIEPTTIYFGTREAMIVEVAAFDPTVIGVRARECRYLVLPVGDAQFDTEWMASKAEAKSHSKHIASHYPNCKVVFIA